jgi:hypothetical protein
MRKLSLVSHEQLYLAREIKILAQAQAEYVRKLLDERGNGPGWNWQLAATRRHWACSTPAHVGAHGAVDTCNATSDADMSPVSESACLVIAPLAAPFSFPASRSLSRAPT